MRYIQIDVYYTFYYLLYLHHSVTPATPSIHVGVNAWVADAGLPSDTFQVTNDTKQGCVSTYLLFAIYFAAMLQVAFKEQHVGSPKCSTSLTRASFRQRQTKVSATVWSTVCR